MLFLYTLITLGIPATLMINRINVFESVSSGINALLRAGQRGQKRMTQMDSRYRWFAPLVLLILIALYLVTSSLLGS